MRSNEEFLQSMSTMDANLEHDPAECGHCCTPFLMAQVAREMLERGDADRIDAISLWDTEYRRRWRETKFWKLWQQETAAGRDPRVAFAAMGWEP